MTDLFQQEDQSNKDFFAELVGEGKKFKSPQDLAKGKYEADLYIKDLERQKDELRNDYLKLREDSMARAKLEELIDQLSTAKQQQSSVTPPAKETEKPGFDPSQLESLLEKKFNEREQTKLKEQNTKYVVDVLKQRFGANYVEHLNKQTEELGLTQETVQYLAENSPKALLRQLGADSFPRTDPFQAPPRTSALFSPKGEQQHTWSYYQQMKKDNPTLYFKPSTQVQMHKDYQTLGKAFEDGDFLGVRGQESAFE